MKQKIAAVLFAVLVAMVVFGFALVVVPALAQNAVPPTAREAATMPAFASRLHPSVTPQVASKSTASARGRSGPALPQDQVIYENGPVNGTTDAWTINFGYVVSDSFTLTSAATVTGFDLYTWEFPGDTLTSVDWSITSSPNGGTVYGSGTVSGSSLTDSFISTNQYGYNIDKISASGLNASGGSGTVYLNLQNAVVASGDPVYWDENSGIGCNSPGCPSQAYESSIGTIPSEAFDIRGTQTPPCDGGDSTLVYSFNSPEEAPQMVTLDHAGNVYGPAGTHGGWGFIFEWANGVLTPLYNFAGGADGQVPRL